MIDRPDPCVGVLRDKVVLVVSVGGTDETARRCAVAGAEVVLAGPSSGPAPEGVRRVALDVGDDTATSEVVAACVRDLGGIDALVCALVPTEPESLLLETGLADLRDAFEAAVHGTLRVVRHATPTLEARHGCVVLVNPWARRRARSQAGIAVVTGSGTQAMAETLATELGPCGIRVNTVAPGPIRVESETVHDDPAALVTSAEVADATVVLASDLFSGVSGACIGVNGREFSVPGPGPLL